MPLVAQADDSTVTLYGKLFLQFQIVKGEGATSTTQPAGERSTLAITPGGNNVTTHNEVNANSSRLGFRGTEPLGGGLKAIWQLEQQINLDVGGRDFASRDSFVGLGGAFGALKLGRLNTVYRVIAGPTGFLGVIAGNFVFEGNLMSRLPFGASKAARDAASFHRTQNNIVQYESPKFGGVQVLVMYSPDETKSASRNRKLYSAGVTYEAGPLYLALGHQIHNDQFGGSLSAPVALRNDGDLNAHSKDTGTRLTAKYKFGGGTTLGADVARLEYKETGGVAGRFQSYKKTSWDIGVEQKLGAWTLAASYTRANDGSCSLFGAAPAPPPVSQARTLTSAPATRSPSVRLFMRCTANCGTISAARYNSLKNGTPDNVLTSPGGLWAYTTF